MDFGEDLKGGVGEAEDADVLGGEEARNAVVDDGFEEEGVVASVFAV